MLVVATPCTVGLWPRGNRILGEPLSFTSDNVSFRYVKHESHKHRYRSLRCSLNLVRRPAARPSVWIWMLECDITSSTEIIHAACRVLCQLVSSLNQCLSSSISAFQERQLFYKSMNENLSISLKKLFTTAQTHDESLVLISGEFKSWHNISQEVMSDSHHLLWTYSITIFDAS